MRVHRLARFALARDIYIHISKRRRREQIKGRRTLTFDTDSQGLHLQEAPENSEVGQLPRAVDILVTNDLVDKVKPGDRVQVVGVYKPLGSGYMYVYTHTHSHVRRAAIS